MLLAGHTARAPPHAQTVSAHSFVPCKAVAEDQRLSPAMHAARATYKQDHSCPPTPLQVGAYSGLPSR